MGRKPNYYNQITDVLKELHSLYPTFNMARHISTALDGYKDIWGVPDKALLDALQKYKLQLELYESPITEGKQLQKIIDDGMDLSDVLEESEEENDLY